jgi:hypothetical protein
MKWSTKSSHSTYQARIKARANSESVENWSNSKSRSQEFESMTSDSNVKQRSSEGECKGRVAGREGKHAFGVRHPEAIVRG